MASAILIVDKPSKCVEAYRKFLVSQGHEVFITATLEDAVLLLSNTPCSVALIGSTLVADLDSPVLAGMKKSCQDCKFVLTTPFFDVETLLKALHGHIFHECLVSPMDPRFLGTIVDHLTHMDEAIEKTYHQATMC